MSPLIPPISSFAADLRKKDRRASIKVWNNLCVNNNNNIYHEHYSSSDYPTVFARDPDLVCF
jgi:hypothetical protein